LGYLEARHGTGTKLKNGFYMTKQGFVTEYEGIYVKKETPTHFIVYVDIYPLVHYPRLSFELCNGVLEYRGIKGGYTSLSYNSLFYTIPIGVLIYYTSPYEFDKGAVIFLLCILLFFMCLTVGAISATKSVVRRSLDLQKLQSMDLINEGTD
jgi:hypothetical protein